MYGVKLVSYDGEKFDMWIHEDNGRFETSSLQEATDKLTEYSDRNPKGCYVIAGIEETDVN